ncbi:MAG: histidine--tRNA ligase, partial [Ruminococcaceae bacterium]|nr:histidine--tRNA ligase [Oscillospiraceae bacterium]
MFIKETVKGMRDILPAEMEIREYLLSKLKYIYTSFGFTQIETPCMERIENLTSNQGGENEKLIFKVLKRGEKLNESLNLDNPDDLCDSGMRYDLTVPLSRYFANNAGQLPMPFKALQVGSVWRADRPQKGRYRQFTQCDIDILGNPDNTAESELIYVTSLFLDSVGVKGNTVMVNDRRILKGMAKKAGFAEE